MCKIHAVYAREVLDSRGNPTVEVEIRTTSGAFGRAMVPSGASTGKYEAIELRDTNENRYGNKGVLTAVKNVNELICNSLKGLCVTEQKKIDQVMIELDHTENKKNLGANAMLGVSMACVRAAADYYHMPLYQYIGGIYGRKMPIPMMNVLNGGAHTADGNDFQEFMIIPRGADCFREGLRIGTEVYHMLKQLLKKKNHITAVGDEGGFAPAITEAFQMFEILTEAVEKAGYKPGKDVVFAMDAAASELYNADSGLYMFQRESGVSVISQPDTIASIIYRNTDQMIELYERLAQQFPLVSIEDALDENDLEGWKKITQRLGAKMQLVGDDLFVTNAKRLKMGILEGCANAILIKPNQIGTISETLETIELAKAYGYQTIISHRSGETEDTFIADLSVAVNAGQIKTGAPCRSERVAKYNRLLRIEELINS